MIRTALACVIVYAVGLTGTAALGGDGPILDPADADELAAELNEVAAVQGICYGWQVTVRDEQAGTTSVDLGSSRGVGERVQDPSCRQWMIFDAALTYTPSDSESEDSATFRVLSNVSDAPTDADLRRIGITGNELLGPEDDLAVINATLALSTLAAERGLAPAVPLEPNSGDIPATDGPTGRPGSDWTRSFGNFIALSVALAAGGAIWAAWAWAAERYDWNSGDGDDA